MTIIRWGIILYEEPSYIVQNLYLGPKLFLITKIKTFPTLKARSSRRSEIETQVVVGL